jgi:aquaporin Z
MTPPVRIGPRASVFPSFSAALRAHWTLYFYEAAELAAFMLSACAFTVLLYHPASPLAALDPLLRRVIMGLAMAATAIVIIKSPFGQRSGAHFNPAITLTFYRLGKIGPYDALFYVVAHFLGAPAGVGFAALLAGHSLAAPQVNFAVTVPGIGGPMAAFAAETFMAALLMGTVLMTSNRPRLAPWTTWLVGLLIASYIVVFAPVSGFSINPARTVGSAVFANLWTSIWIYFTAPLLGMFGAAEIYVRVTGIHAPHYFSHRHLEQRSEP